MVCAIVYYDCFVLSAMAVSRDETMGDWGLGEVVMMRLKKPHTVGIIVQIQKKVQNATCFKQVYGWAKKRNSKGFSTV